MAMEVTYWRGSASSCSRHLRTSFVGSASSNSACSGCTSSSSQSSGLESPVPRWSMKSTSRVSLRRVKSGITCAASDTAPCPGPPANTMIGSCSLARSRAGTTATLMSMRRPDLATRSSQTGSVPHCASASTPGRRQLASARAERGASEPEVQAASNRAGRRCRRFME